MLNPDARLFALGRKLFAPKLGSLPLSPPTNGHFANGAVPLELSTNPPCVEGRVEPRLPTLPGNFDGLATPDSVNWRVNGEISLLLGWGRAILLQIAHPKVAAGVADHSQFRASSAGARIIRFQHTVSTMLELNFGTVDEAWLAARRIDGIHGRVVGTLADDVGNHAGGTAYFARDPELLRWVYATLVDSFIRTYELFVGPLTSVEKDQYCRESVVIGPMLGIPDGFLPSCHADLLAYMRDLIGSGQICVGPTARDLASHILAPPIPIVGVPLMALAKLPIVGLLPEPIRSGYGLPWDPRREMTLVVAASVVRSLQKRLPPTIHRWPAAERRVAELLVGGHAETITTSESDSSSIDRRRCS